MTNKRINFIIDEKVHKDFSKLCDKLGIVMGKHLENYMKEFIKKNKNKEILRLK